MDSDDKLKAIFIISMIFLFIMIIGITSYTSLEETKIKAKDCPCLLEKNN
jgi:CHASE3 domain sensor protein